MSDTNDAAEGQVNQAGGAPGMSIIGLKVESRPMSRCTARTLKPLGCRPPSTALITSSRLAMARSMPAHWAEAGPRSERLVHSSSS